MAGTHPFLTKLRGVLKTLDDDALTALANKGLLRRAQKDLEASRPTIASVEEGQVRVQFAEATVVVPELLSKSTCTCPATGVCRHILGVLLYLRDDPDLVAADALVQKTLELGDDQEAATAAAAARCERACQTPRSGWKTTPRACTGCCSTATTRGRWRAWAG